MAVGMEVNLQCEAKQDKESEARGEIDQEKE